MQRLISHKTWLVSSFSVTWSSASLSGGCIVCSLAPRTFTSISRGTEYYSTLLPIWNAPKAHFCRKTLLKGVSSHLLHFCVDGNLLKWLECSLKTLNSHLSAQIFYPVDTPNSFKVVLMLAIYKGPQSHSLPLLWLSKLSWNGLEMKTMC